MVYSGDSGDTGNMGDSGGHNTNYSHGIGADHPCHSCNTPIFPRQTRAVGPGQWSIVTVIWGAWSSPDHVDCTPEIYLVSFASVILYSQPGQERRSDVRDVKIVKTL